MQLFAPALTGDDKICRLQQTKVLGHRLTGHIVRLAKFSERQAPLLLQAIEEFPPTRVCKRLKYPVIFANHGFSICNLLVACQVLTYFVAKFVAFAVFRPKNGRCFGEQRAISVDQQLGSEKR